jgi:hypothetical protein
VKSGFIIYLLLTYFEKACELGENYSTVLSLSSVVRLIKMRLNESYSKVRRGKSISFVFPNDLKQENTPLPLVFKIARQYATRKVQENQEG